MSENDEELELEALQRRLDDAFASTRPRAGLEDELWLRIQARRPIRQRLVDVWTALWAGLREVPAIPAAAAALVLVIAVAAGLATMNGLIRAPGAREGATALSSVGSGHSSVSGAFGRLPLPAQQASNRSVTAGIADTGLAGPQAGTIAPLPASPQADTIAPARSGVVYAGPVRLTWSGTLPAVAQAAPVYRYIEPGDSGASAFAASLGAALQSGAAPGADLGTFSGDGFVVAMRSSTTPPVLEPSFYLVPDAGTNQSAGDPLSVANAYLSAHSLVPAWAYTTEVDADGGESVVRYLRQFSAGASGQAYLVDPSGMRYGLEVTVRDGRPSRVVGPIPVELQSAEYPIIGANVAVAEALKSSSATAAAPAVTLDRAELVYALALADGTGYYEPCFLFSGDLKSGGVAYTVNVLVPAVPAG